MAVLKHFSIKNSPLATLKYIVGETKEHKAAIVTGLKCSEDPESAYMEMAMCYEHYAGEKFHRVGNPTGKEHLKMHHYVISFKGWEVTPQEAHRIAEQWAKEIFGDNHQVLIATHADTKNIHVHLAANAFNMDGKRWLDNKKTLNLCKEKINKLCWLKNLSVIENPKWNANQNYAEWLARQNGTSWKKKLCDDIDRIVLMENVHSIDDLVVQLCNCGYLVRQGKYLSVRPANLENRKPVRTLKLGDGYGLEELKYRIENKDKEGYLRLRTGDVCGTVADARNTLTQRTFGPECGAYIKLDVSGMKEGDAAGLAAFAEKYGYVAVKIEDGKKYIVTVWYDDNDDVEREFETERVEIAENEVYLRVDCDYKNAADKAYFYYSLDGENWTKIGNTLQMNYYGLHFMGYRYAIFNFPTKQSGGYVDVDFFRVENKLLK